MGDNTVELLGNLDRSAFRRLVAGKLRLTPRGKHGDHHLNPEFREWVLDRARRPAAVLIPVVQRDDLKIILTKRTDHLTSHSGQIAFPGGKIDPSDESPEAAALRESREEIDLEPKAVEIIGRLPDYHTGSGYRIAPIIGLVDSAARLRANPQEVEYVFEVPLAFLMNPANHHQASRDLQGKKRHFFEMPYDTHHIWGITAGILRMMQERLFS